MVILMEIKVNAEVFNGTEMPYTVIAGSINITNEPLPNKYYPAILKDTPDTLNLVVSPTDADKLRQQLLHNTTPLPSQHNKNMTLWWQGNNFGRMANNNTNSLGNITYPNSNIRLDTLGYEKPQIKITHV